MYKLSKVLFALFMINYILINRIAPGYIWMNYALIAGFTVTGLISSPGAGQNGKMHLRLNIYFRYWMLFTIYVLLTGFVVAINYSIVLNQVIFLAEVLVIMVYVIRVSENDGSLKYFYQVFTLVAALYAFSMLRSGVTHFSSGRLYLSETSNPNSDGIILAFGIYSTLKLIDYNRLGKLILFFALTVIEFYTIFLTGSRKALILAAAFFVFTFLRMWNMRRELTSNTKILLGAISIAAFAFAVTWMLPKYLQSAAYNRMQDADVGMQDRFKIALDALRVFIQHPLFGVGINNYKMYSSYGLYAHSTIPELLAGTGIFGTVLFFTPYFSVLGSLLRKRMKRIDRVEIWRLLICLMAVSFVMIIPYGLPLSFFSILLFMETDLAKKTTGREN